MEELVQPGEDWRDCEPEMKDPERLMSRRRRDVVLGCASRAVRLINGCVHNKQCCRFCSNKSMYYLTIYSTISIRNWCDYWMSSISPRTDSKALLRGCNAL